jgi:hypothetical protein
MLDIAVLDYIIIGDDRYYFFGDKAPFRRFAPGVWVWYL